MSPDGAQKLGFQQDQTKGQSLGILPCTWLGQARFGSPNPLVWIVQVIETVSHPCREDSINTIGHVTRVHLMRGCGNYLNASTRDLSQRSGACG